MQEITPHVTSLHVDLKWFPQPYPPNVFLIKEGGEAALIDSGFSDDESYNTRIKFLEAHSGAKIKYLVLTHHHYDHSSGAHRLRDATGAGMASASNGSASSGSFSLHGPPRANGPYLRPKLISALGGRPRRSCQAASSSWAFICRLSAARIRL